MVALTALVALGLVLSRSAWPYTRVLVTITHEGGHAVAALVAGRRLQGIRLHSDTSGLTVSSGRPAVPGMVGMLLAGYLAPALVGLAAVGLLIAGYSLGLLWLLVILLALMLLQIRNFYGSAIVVVGRPGWSRSAGGPPAAVQSTLAYLLTWMLLVAAPKPVLELIRIGVGTAGAAVRRRPARPADPGTGRAVVGSVPGGELRRAADRRGTAAAGGGRGAHQQLAAWRGPGETRARRSSRLGRARRVSAGVGQRIASVRWATRISSSRMAGVAALLMAGSSSRRVRCELTAAVDGLREA